MYLGVIGGVKFADTKTVVDGGTAGTTTTTTYQSPFNATVAFALNNNMGFHYTIKRNDVADTTILTKSDTQENTVNNQNSEWLHEIAFGMKLDNGMEFYIPLGIPIVLNTITTKASGTIDADSVIGNGGTVSIALNPTFSMPLDLGLFNKLEFNAGIRFGVYNDLNKIDRTTTVGSTTTGKRDANKKWVNTTWDIGVTPTFEWDLSEKISFMAEPTVNFRMSIVSDGQEQTLVTNGTAGAAPQKNVVTRYGMYPSIDIPIGVVMKPIDWFEIRTGARYNVQWNITDTETKTDADTTKDSVATAPSNSIFLYGGVGFILAEDFYIDLAFVVSDILTTNNVDLFDDLLGNVTLQFSYRF